MDVGIGIGELNTSNEELVESKFDIFSKVEYENGIKQAGAELGQAQPQLGIKSV